MLKRLIKSVLRGLATLIVSPLLLTHGFASLLNSADRSIESHSQLLSLLPGTLGNYLRVAFFRRTLEYCHPSVTICFGTLFSKTGARIEKHVYIGPNCMIGLATIHQDVLIGPAVQIPSGPRTHGIAELHIPIRQQQGTPERIVIGADSWIGCQSVILADVAEKTVVAAGTVVTKRAPSKSVIGGVPAKLLRSREVDAVSKSNI